MNLADGLRNEAIAAHREEGARLRVHHDEQHGRQACDGARADERRAEAVAELAQHEGDRLGVVELGIGHVARHDGRHGDVEHGADEQRCDDARRHVVRGVLRLLCRGRDGVNAEVGEDDDGGAGGDAGEAERHEGLPVRRVDGRRGEEQEQEDGGELDADEDFVDRDALAHAAHEQAGQEERDEHRGQVDDAAVGGHGRPGGGQLDAGGL